jgi:hypothetical protein
MDVHHFYVSRCIFMGLYYDYVHFPEKVPFVAQYYEIRTSGRFSVVSGNLESVESTVV